jgi:hypothetical protein
VPSRSVRFLRCPKCVAQFELTGARPLDLARLEVGLTGDGFLEIRCVAHDRVVGLMPYGGLVGEPFTSPPGEDS